jgi:nucleotide-binding universal stress UspA family protein
MNAKRILIPIDVAACPLEIFPCINEFANEPGAEITLLHVSRLNVICPENRFYVELKQEVQTTLEKLRSTFITPCLRTQISSRIGNPASEIVALANELRTDLIVLTCRAGQRRRRIFETHIVETVVRNAPCAVQVLRVNSRVDFIVQFGKGEKVVANTEIARASWRPENIYASL